MGLSIWSVSIILDRKKYFSSWKELLPLDDITQKLQKGEIENHLDINDPRLEYLKKTTGSNKENLDHFFIAYINDAEKEWKKGLPVLGTLALPLHLSGCLYNSWNYCFFWRVI